MAHPPHTYAARSDLLPSKLNPTAQIIVLDAGGQYCHLIARKVRDLGVYAEVRASETPAAELATAKGIIISGGPSSVYDPESPTVDPAIFSLGMPVLGICYGQQLMAHLLGGEVRKGDQGRVRTGHARTRRCGRPAVRRARRHAAGLDEPSRRGGARAGGFLASRGAPAPARSRPSPRPRAASTPCSSTWRWSTPRAARSISPTSCFGVCGCEKDWDVRHRAPLLEQEIRECVGDAQRLLLRQRRRGFQRGLRALHARAGRRARARRLRRYRPDARGRDRFRAPHGQPHRGARRGAVSDRAGRRHRSRNRSATSSARSSCACRSASSNRAACWTSTGFWGRARFIPTRSNSGGTAKAALIKTHHNRVAGIQKLIEAGRIVEPLKSFYKDEVREVGREIGLAGELLDRHPFPGPGLAIRCLCSEFDAPLRATPEGFIVPVHSVGVQGDSRTLRAGARDRRAGSCARHRTDQRDLRSESRDRAGGDARCPLASMQVRACSLTRGAAGALAPARTPSCAASLTRRGYDHEVWQFPVILIPLGSAASPDSVVLRPVDSVDGMTAQSVLMKAELRERIARSYCTWTVSRAYSTISPTSPPARSSGSSTVLCGQSAAAAFRRLFYFAAGSLKSIPSSRFSRSVSSRSIKRHRCLIVGVAGREVVQRVAVHPIGHSRVDRVILKGEQIAVGFGGLWLGNAIAAGAASRRWWRAAARWCCIRRPVRAGS